MKYHYILKARQLTSPLKLSNNLSSIHSRFNHFIEQISRIKLPSVQVCDATKAL